jgi:hypothetical protein
LQLRSALSRAEEDKSRAASEALQSIRHADMAREEWRQRTVQARDATKRNY